MEGKEGLSGSVKVDGVWGCSCQPAHVSESPSTPCWELIAVPPDVSDGSDLPIGSINLDPLQSDPSDEEAMRVWESVVSLLPVSQSTLCAWST